jgi:hypothetical protein
MSGALDMGTHQINNVVDPTLAQDASTKNYTDSKVEDTIVDSVTDKAPSQNAVFDALALKADDSVVVKSVNGVSPVANAVTIDTDDVSEGATNLYFTDGRAQTAVITQTITNGVTDKSPSEDAVFDALALKLDLAGGTLTGDLVLSNEHSIQFTESSPGTDYVEVKAPASVSANYTLTLPPAVAASNGSALVSDTSGNLSYAYIIPSYTGDIPRTSFTALDNQIVVANVTGLAFPNATVQGFETQITVVRSSDYAEYTLKGIQKGASWEMSQDYIGDDTGLVFSINSSGQVQYTSTSTGNTAAILFRANTV